MALSRRHFLIMGLGALAAGCAEQSAMRVVRPGPIWPDAAAPFRPPTVAAPRSPLTPAVAGPVYALDRARWARGQAIAAKLNPLVGVNRITVHHEGSTTVSFTDEPTTAQRLEIIRQQHLQRGWGDIGYHYVIDRAGRVWHGRDLRFQGAHVKGKNENNLGIMCLGNFDTQSPTSAQLVTLRATLAQTMRYYRVPVGRVYTHQELNPTACPGRSLQPQMVALRRSGSLA